jgi:rod shape-determining protein MreD
MAAQLDSSPRRSLEPEYLLLPVNPWFIWATLLVALALNFLPWGRQPWLPDWVAIVLVFWNVHQPRRVGMGAAFVFGLLMDVHSGALLGQHSLAYSLLSYFAIAIHRRLLWFTMGTQALHVLPLFAAAHATTAVIRLVADGLWPGWSYLLAPVAEAALWPVVSFMLLAPQRRPPDPDENRPVL